MKTFTPHNYQNEASQFVQDNLNSGLFLDAGIGKTATTLDAIVKLKAAGKVNKVLIMAPLRVIHGVWKQEAAKWDNFSHLKFMTLHGKNKQTNFNTIAESDADIVLMNYDGLKWFREQMKSTEESPFDMLVLDESTAIKDTRTKRFRHLKVLLQHFERKVLLTGTPAPNSMLDLYGQFFVLDQGAALGRNMQTHRNLFWESDPFNVYSWILKPGADEEITKRTAPLVKRMSAEMYLELPEMIIQDINVQLPEKVRKMYNDVEANYFSMLDDGIIEAANAAVAAGKLRQIASGGFYYEPEPGVRSIKQVHDVKTEAVVETVEQCGDEPVMVMYEFKHELQRLQKAFPDAPVIKGGMSGKQLQAVTDEWNAGNTPVLLVQPQSASHGLNLQSGGRHMIWATLTWSGERYLQAMKRLHRQGQEQTVFIHRIIAEDTIDEAVMANLAGKEANQTAFLDAVYEYRKNRGL